MNTATGNSILRAYSKTAKRVMGDVKLTTASTSAGFIIPNGQKPGARDGWQVFVKMIRYSDVKLKKCKLSGGLFGRI